MVGQLVAAHGLLIGASPKGGNGASAAVDVGDVSVAEVGEVRDGLVEPLVVGGSDDVDPGGWDRPADDDDR